MDPLYRRLHEATETGTLTNPEDVERAMRSANPYLQWIGCKAAGLSGTESWTDLLRHHASEHYPSRDPDVNSIAVWALARVAGNQEESVWREMSRSDSPDARRAVADLIG